MKRTLNRLSRRYQTALRAHLKQRRPGSLSSARSLQREFMAEGQPIVELANVHERFLVREMLPGCAARKRDSLIGRAAEFFATTVDPGPPTVGESRRLAPPLHSLITAMSRHAMGLAAANLALNAEVAQRQAAETALRRSERHYAKLLKQSDRLQLQSRRLSRQILSAQEEERKEISRELHDVIAQTLTAINIRLAALKREAAINTKGFDRTLADAQRLVEKSVKTVHQFALELRPAVLDDLGLIPALHSYMKNFTTRTGVRSHLISFADVERLDTARRTVLFRVAQEALTNIARHAKASRADVKIARQPGSVRMEIKDDGRAFNVERALRASVGRRLGLLGMRERLEMVGGEFGVQSTPGQGTLVTALIPFDRLGPRGKRVDAAANLPQTRL